MRPMRGDVSRFNLRQASLPHCRPSQTLQFARDNLANFKRTVELNREMLQQGEIARADFLRIQLQMLQFETDLDDANLELNDCQGNSARLAWQPESSRWISTLRVI